MTSLSFLTLSVVSPVCFGLGDILLLALLCPTDKDYELLAILAEIDPVSRAEVDPPFGNTGTDRFYVAQIPGFNPGNRGADFRRGTGIEVLEPIRERTDAGFGFIMRIDKGMSAGCYG